LESNLKEGSVSFHQTLSFGFRLILESFQQSDSLPFSDVLTVDQVESAFEKSSSDRVKDADEVYTPAITLWAFLSQILHDGKERSCLAAVARISLMLVALGRPRCIQNNGAYCRARGRLPLVVIERLALDIATGCEKQVGVDELWKGRHVKLVDGTTSTMADTEDNQDEYPQQSCQEEGLGFPIVRYVLLLSLATAMINGMAMAPYQGKETGELALLRELFNQLNPGDVLLADKLYCSYFMIALLMEYDVDMVVRLHHARKLDLQRAKRLGKNDYLVTWERPDRPSWMEVETYARMPETLQLRLVQLKITEPGFRTESIDVVTTLTDAEQYRGDEITALYGKRWLAELDIRSIKTTLQMEHLRCKSPEMVRKELWTCLLAYNVIRQKMLQSAKAKGISPRMLSFTNAVQLVNAGWMMMPVTDSQTQAALTKATLKGIAEQQVGKESRKGRIEPRAVKRRPKPFRLLTMTRDAARALLRRGIDPFKKQR